MATLLGDATLQTTATLTADDSVLATNDITVEHTTGFRRPIGILDVTNNASGSFLAMVGNQQVEYADSDYVQSDLFSDAEPLTYSQGVLNSPKPITDKFIFDFAEINELSTTVVTQITYKITFKTISVTGGTTADIIPRNNNFGGGFSVNDFNTNTSLSAPDGFTGEVGQTFTKTYIINDFVSGTGTFFTNHNGSFQPFFVQFRQETAGSFQVIDVQAQVKYRGKTLLKQDFVENDTVTLKQFEADGTEFPLGEPIQGLPANFAAANTDQLSFNWPAGAFDNPGGNYVIKGLQVIEFCRLLRGPSFALENNDTVRSRFMPGGSSGPQDVALTIGGQYTVIQDGSVTATNMITENPTTRSWVPDGPTGAVNDIARPNALLSYNVGDINQDITTSLTLRTPYASADSGASSGNSNYNAPLHFEFATALKDAPNGKTGYEDFHGSAFQSGSRDQSTVGAYRSRPFPNMKMQLRMLYAPAINGESSISSASAFNITDLIGVLHGMGASDVGTYTSSSAFTGQGGFVLLGESTNNTASFTMSVPHAGFQLSVIEEESTTATMTIDDNGVRMFLRGDANLTSTFTLTEDVDLFLGTITTPPSTFSFSFGLLGVKIAMASTDLNVLASSMTVTATGDVLTNPDPARTFVLADQETRTLKVDTQTRTATVNTQTRQAKVDAQVRTATVDAQTRTLTIPGYDG
jgi:hypothetical protein